MTQSKLSTLVTVDGRTYDASIPDAQQALLRLMVATNYPGGWTRQGSVITKFGDIIDPWTLRPIALSHRHSETGVWILRVDGLEKADPPPRRKPAYGSAAHEGALVARYRFMFFDGDYGGLTDLICPWREDLVPVTVAHYARQVLDPDGPAKSWPVR